MNVLAFFLITCSCFIKRLECCVCGKSKIHSRIVGGMNAMTDEYPWQAAVITHRGDKTMLCGGSIINDRYVLTAAHCVGPNYPEKVRIIVGSTDLNTYWEKGVQAASFVLFNGQYGIVNNDHDIALIKLAQPLAFNESISPICLPDVSMQKFQLLMAAGWGAVEYRGNISKQLKTVYLHQKDEYCAQKCGGSHCVRKPAASRAMSKCDIHRQHVM